MLRERPIWTRELRVYRALTAAGSLEAMDAPDDAFDARIHARSRFRSQDDPRRLAVYTVHDRHAWTPPAPACDPSDHTLIVVREFRRVPLHASALAMLLVTARGGCAAPVVAALAHFVERAVSLYQPAYLLLAHSLEQPRISALMLGVHECAALASGGPAAFSIETLLPELAPLLAQRPEWFAYCPEPQGRSAPSTLVSPYAV